MNRYLVWLFIGLIVGLFFVLMFEFGKETMPDDDDIEVGHTIVDVSLPKPQHPLVATTSTSAPATSTTARARTAPTVAAASTSRPLVVAPVGELQNMIRQGFARFGPEVAEEAVRVAGCESTGDPSGQRLDPNAIGDEGEVGLFQIHPRYHTARAAKFGWSMNDLFDPAKNIVVAVDILAEKRGRWSPTWSCGYAA